MIASIMYEVVSNTAADRVMLLTYKTSDGKKKCFTRYVEKNNGSMTYLLIQFLDQHLKVSQLNIFLSKQLLECCHS